MSSILQHIKGGVDEEKSSSVAANNEKNSWMNFSLTRPNASSFVHQAAALLHSMEESLRCHICQDIFTIPVSIQPCNHSFCNDCIRKKLQEEASEVSRCPICSTPLDASIDLSKCIVLNRNHEETARHYKTLRPVLRQALITGTKLAPGAASTLAASASSMPIKKKLKPRGPYAKLSKKHIHMPTEDTDTQKERTPWKKRGNSWIRDQFREEFLAEKETWAYVCIHCAEHAFRSREKKTNATKLTEHITLKCPMATPEMKEEAVSHTQGAKRIKRIDYEMGEAGYEAKGEVEEGYC